MTPAPALWVSQALRARGATMHRWAVAHIGLDRLRAALAAPTPTYYWPPGHDI